MACIEALRPHVCELILIDTESTDCTRELAAPRVDHIISQPNFRNFDAVRNTAIPAATYDWLWFVDADERIPFQTGRVVNQLIRERGHEFEAIVIPFRTYFCGQWIRHCGWWPGYTMPRVLRRGSFCFSDKLHGGVDVNGRSIYLSPDPETAILHYSYENIEHYIDKLNRYTSTEAIQMNDAGARFDWRQSLRHMTYELWNYYERHSGYLDGVRGWLLSWLSSQYRLISHAKLIDLSGTSDVNGQQPDVPLDLDVVLEVMSGELAACRRATPQLPLGVVWRGPLWDPSGYADESRLFIRSLACGEREFAVEDIHWATQECNVSSEDASLFRALLRARRPKYSATITNCICTLVEPVQSSSLNILRTTFETDRLPDGWLDCILAFDEIWVFSQHDYRTFVRSWVPPEKLRVVPSCFNERLFIPDGERLELPEALRERFVFLSIFDWNIRKGWDLLLKAYAQAFRVHDNVGLLLKITRNHGHTFETVTQEADEALSEVGYSLAERPDIVLWDEILDASEIAALYRSVNAFVLPSRGEGWGKPYMEAMASGLPCIGTNASGNIDFMTEENSFLVPAHDVEVPGQAAHGMQTYERHRWHEPILSKLKSTLRRVFRDSDEAKRRGNAAANQMRSHYDLAAGGRAIEFALREAESRFVIKAPPNQRPGQIRVEFEGELYSGHSFAKVNESLLRHLTIDDELAITFTQVVHYPVIETPSNHLAPFVGRTLEGGPDVTIRHAFPPNWDSVKQGRWVHIQPWEYGHLPASWVAPLRDLVDEVWVPSNYVRQVYERSGIDPSKIQVIPWGVDMDVFRPDAIPLLLPGYAKFRFLFVGGAIARKGFDRVLDAYLAEFSVDDEVCLVIKDMGADSFYRDSAAREVVRQAAADPKNPEIVYLDQRLTEGQLAGLYTACDCLVAPYRGEGFGLPILEAMTCGLPAIIPRGGPSDDFTSEATAFYLPSREIQITHPWPLCGPALELEVEASDVRRTMRQAYRQKTKTRRIGAAAADSVRKRYTWSQTAAQMIERIRALAPPAEKDSTPVESETGKSNACQVGAILLLECSIFELAENFAMVAPFVDKLTAVVVGDDSRSSAIAQEYGATLHSALNRDQASAVWRHAIASMNVDWLWLPQSITLMASCNKYISNIRRYLSDLNDKVVVVTFDIADRPSATEYFVRSSEAKELLTDPFAAPQHVFEKAEAFVSQVQLPQDVCKTHAAVALPESKALLL